MNEMRDMELIKSIKNEETMSYSVINEQIHILEKKMKENPKDYETLYTLGNLYYDIDKGKAIK